ncbi:hypothetical protein SASPL_150455 [Salvia splendens]|uniref:Uncharacterized protein n=1 Tax=Salvia splendens TaxID=180675 RepID=A0A8X8W693_SALSN|nr:hypothetical protein SASPL_150455 [Salvia splendens]
MQNFTIIFVIKHELCDLSVTYTPHNMKNKIERKFSTLECKLYSEKCAALIQNTDPLQIIVSRRTGGCFCSSHSSQSTSPSQSLALVQGESGLSLEIGSDVRSSHFSRSLPNLAFHSGLHAQSRSTLEIPIFWFIHNEGLLVDKHQQARALSDMVVVVQSEPSSWESHLQCNGQSLLWDLRLKNLAIILSILELTSCLLHRRPTKAALAAVSEHLAGVLPLHLVYSQVHETAIEDWTRSVGCNPVFCYIWRFTCFPIQSDTIARSYILTTLEESIQLVNSAINLLLMERTCILFLVSRSLFQALQENYVMADALRLLYTLEDTTKGFADYVNGTVASLHPIHCTRQRKVFLRFLLLASCTLVVLKPRRPKPKIN